MNFWGEKILLLSLLFSIDLLAYFQRFSMDFPSIYFPPMFIDFIEQKCNNNIDLVWMWKSFMDFNLSANFHSIEDFPRLWSISNEQVSTNTHTPTFYGWISYDEFSMHQFLTINDSWVFSHNSHWLTLNFHRQDPFRDINFPIFHIGNQSIEDVNFFSKISVSIENHLKKNRKIIVK